VDRAEGWLLDAIHELRTPVSWLASPNRVALFNMPDHRLSMVDLIACLERLAGRGWIDFRDAAGTLFGLSEIDLRRELERTDRGGVAYGLTALGGRIWESEAQADWSRFIYAWSTEKDEAGRDWEMICATETRARDWLAMHRTAPPPLGFESVAEIWDVCAPFEATYWKTLPRGHRVFYAERRIQDTPVASCAIARRNGDLFTSKYLAFCRWKRDLAAP